MEYDFNLQRFIILSPNQKLKIPQKFVEFQKYFEKYCILPKKELKSIDFRYEVIYFLNSYMKLPNLQWNSQKFGKLICFEII